MARIWLENGLERTISESTYAVLFPFHQHIVRQLRFDEALLWRWAKDSLGTSGSNSII